MRFHSPKRATVNINPPLSMLPTPDTSHVPYGRVYEPAEDSFLLIDTLASDAERRFLQRALPPVPLVVELGSGSGVVVAFVHAHAAALLGRGALTAAVDVNAFACRATAATVARAGPAAPGLFLGACLADLAAPWRRGCVDVLLFNPPYVPTPELPACPDAAPAAPAAPSFARDSHLLELAYAGGRDGMETTDRLLATLPRILSPRGCAYVLLCVQNRPDDVKTRIHTWGPEWRALTVRSSGKTAGWEKLQVVRIWRDVAT